jgi:hypothetical protein
MFENFVKQIGAQFKKMCDSGKLYTVELPNITDAEGKTITTGYQLWDTYISSFKPGDDPVFRHPDSTSHTCNLDKNFIKNYGNIIAIINNKIVSMWDIALSEDSPYFSPCKALSESVKSGKITNVFLETFENLHKCNYQKTNKNLSLFQLGRDIERVRYTSEQTFGNVIPDKIYEFHFFHVMLPKQFVDFSNKSVEAITGELRTTRQLFEKTLNIPLDTLELVRDLIQQGSLLRGDMYKPKVLEVIKLKKEFEKIANKELYLWENFQTIPFARFANELIGTTCIELAEGKELNKVCHDFNYRVDPANYNKAKAPITPQMIALAEKQIQELGYIESFERRFATLDNIDVNEIRYSNIDNSVEKPVGLFGKAGVPVSTAINRHKRAEFDKIESVTIDKFMQDILPNATSVEVFLENKMQSNLVSMFTSQKPSKNLFKWSNPFSWTYNGNLSGKSMIKDAVASRGGKTDAKVRVSIHFPNTTDDYDLHCVEPNRNNIYYGNKRTLHSSSGMLDLDAQGGDGHQPPDKRVENLTYSDLSKMPKGTYDIYVNNYSGRGLHTAFNIEVEIDGDITLLEFNKTSNTVNKKSICKLHFDGNAVTFTPENCVVKETKTLSKNIWNLDTNSFHKVNLICTSPNHWGDNAIGTKEWFFMLQDCKTDQPMRAFHVDQLHSDLMPVRKAIDLLGNYKQVQPAEKQLAGIGFNATQRDELIVKVKGSHQRVIKILF